MKAYCLASSSSGNCYILEFEINGVPTRIMVECGIPLKEIYRRAALNMVDVSTIQCCLVTHAHGDHSKAIHDLNRLGVPVFASRETLSLLGAKGIALVEKQPHKICDGVMAMSFAVEHDIEGAVGFVIKTTDECVIFVNDHKKWDCDLSNFKPDYVFIECNYDHVVVYAQLNALKKKKSLGFSSVEEAKDVNMRIAQHTRNLNSHCSLHGAICGLKKLNLSRCCSIFLMHLSDRYANEYRMKNEVQLEVGVLTYVCGKLGGIK